MIKDLDRISPIKREKIRHGMESAEKASMDDAPIEKIVVFGSSIRGDCTEESDIDLCAFTDRDMMDDAYHKIRGGLPWELDDICGVIDYGMADDELKKETDRGVTVYERA